MGDAWAANMYLQVDRRRVALLIVIQDGLPKQRHILAGIAASCICSCVLHTAYWAKVQSKGV